MLTLAARSLRAAVSVDLRRVSAISCCVSRFSRSHPNGSASRGHLRLLLIDGRSVINNSIISSLGSPENFVFLPQLPSVIPRSSSARRPSSVAPRMSSKAGRRLARWEILVFHSSSTFVSPYLQQGRFPFIPPFDFVFGAWNSVCVRNPLDWGKLRKIENII
ncbi:unnamed protein product [Linum trigynum]|uniref:Uncharacterized protein n=1 Tax=Linum trigynum TaxID=586398 RepID=A0AAV2GTD9_9ROSI